MNLKRDDDSTRSHRALAFLDTQYVTEHLNIFGAVEIRRRRYPRCSIAISGARAAETTETWFAGDAALTKACRTNAARLYGFATA